MSQITELDNTKLIYGTVIPPGKKELLQLPIDKLPTGTLIKIPVYVFNGKEPGPTMLIQGGLHGDEINGVEICRRMLTNKYFERLKKGCVVIVPLLNVFGFIYNSREVTDGKDVNRSFPGSKSGSLASRIAYTHMQEIVKHIDFGIDLHTGGSMRNNHPQIRYTEQIPDTKKLAEVFRAPFYFASKMIPKSFRQACYKNDKPIIVYEGGESARFDEFAINEGIEGIIRLVRHFDMVADINHTRSGNNETIHLNKRRWLRARNGGVFCPVIHNGSEIKKGQILGHISDAFGNNRKPIKAPFDGFIFCINNKPLVSKGDALFHVGEV